MQRHAYSYNLVIFAVLLEVCRVVALITVNNEQTVGTNTARLCVLAKVLKLLKTKLVRSPAVFRDSNDPILG